MKYRFYPTMILIIAFSWFASGQINHESTYDYSGIFTSLARSGDKFYVMDIPRSQCRIYNMDHSIWKVINLQVPADHYLYDIKYVSEGLFTSDDRLSLAYVYYNYDESTQVYSYFARVVTETGQVLLSVPGCLYLEVHDMNESGLKLVAYSYDFGVWPYTIQTHVYALPGSIATKAAPGLPAGNPIHRAFPNPSRGFTNIPYELPDGVTEGEIRLVDMHGIAVRTFRVDDHFDHLRIDTSSLPAGVYAHALLAGGRTINQGKLIVR